MSGGGETGEPEVWIMSPLAEAPQVREALAGAGVGPIGPEAFESLRIEAGTPRFGHDVDESVMLPEIPFENLLSYSKGCYPGQEVVVRIRDRGHVNRTLRGLALDGDQVPADEAEVVADDATIGKVTSATWSFGLSRPIALAFVRRQHAEAGTRVSVRFSGTMVAATVSALPFAVAVGKNGRVNARSVINGEEGLRWAADEAAITFRTPARTAASSTLNVPSTSTSFARRGSSAHCVMRIAA